MVSRMPGVAGQAGWAEADSTNLFRPHRANLSWLHQDRLRRGSGPTWICLLAPRNGARPGREQDVPAPEGWGQMKLVLARWSRFDFVGWSQEHLVETGNPARSALAWPAAGVSPQTHCM